MSIKKGIYLVIALWIGSSISAMAQPTHSSDWMPPNTSYPYEKVNIQGYRQPVELPTVSESDVKYMKFVWRRIELKEKINQKLYYPSVDTPERQSLSSVLFNALQSVSMYDDNETAQGPNFKGTPFEGAYTLIAYQDDDFTKPYHNIEDIPIFRARTSLTGITDSLGRQTFDTLRVESRDVLSYMLKEVWFFDAKRSVWDVRIIGICPEYRIKKSIGERPYEHYEQNIWFYFPQARYYLCNKVCYNPHNDLEQWTYDDIFLMRMFNSYIVKESNPQNRMISEYTRGVEAILESERIKKELIEYENNLWEY